MGPIIKQYGAFAVSDDGQPGHRYGVWVFLESDQWSLIGSGMNRSNSLMVAEALNFAKAGCSSTMLVENGKTISLG